MLELDVFGRVARAHQSVIQTESRRHVAQHRPKLPTMLDPLPTYPATAAYVVQLHREARPERGLWIGRIEHVASGASHIFTSRRSLTAWLLVQASSNSPSGGKSQDRSMVGRDRAWPSGSGAVHRQEAMKASTTTEPPDISASDALVAPTRHQKVRNRSNAPGSSLCQPGVYEHLAMEAIVTTSAMSSARAV
jgi:hypothetical protein